MFTKTNLSLDVLKNLWIEIFMNKTDKVTDVSDNSVLNATAFASAKIGQKCVKDISIVEAQIFPDTAQGEWLDKAASLFGVSSRRAAIGSSTYIKIIADPTTEYIAGTHYFINTNGLKFELVSNITIGIDGYGYALVRSIDVGKKTNVEQNSIISVLPIPSTHIAVVNEYRAIGGLDYEDDDVFRLRIKNNLNILSSGTLEYFTQVLQNVDARVLRVFNMGVDEQWNRKLGIVTQNGVEFTNQELEDLLDKTSKYFPITDLSANGDVIGVKYVNIEWDYLGGDTGVDFRVQIKDNYSSDSVRKNIQIAMSKYLDFRFWKFGDKIQWTDLLTIVKNAEGVKYVSDTNFSPNSDRVTPQNKLPRIKVFVMRDLYGNILYSGNNLTPVFYPNN